MSETATISLRQRLVDDLGRQGAMHSSWLAQAFTDVPREVFVPRFHRALPGEGLVEGTDRDQRDEWLDSIYTDRVLVVQYTAAPDMAGPGAPTSSSSQPSVMAGMLEALDPRPAHRVLEIGTGTGYNTALLCRRVGEANVTSIELDPTLADAAREALASIGLYPTVHAGDGSAGLADAAPFDRIIATAATDHIPPAWINQLAPGGIAVVDLRGSLSGSLCRLTADDTEPDVETVRGPFLDLPGAFMPLRTRRHVAHRDGEDWDNIVYDRRNPQRGSTDLDPALIADGPASLRFFIQLQLTGRRLRGFTTVSNDEGGIELAPRAPDGSWFTVNTETDDNGRYALAQGGPQRLWDTIAAAYDLWRFLGEPRIDQFGITARDDPDHQYAWFDRPDSGYRWPLPM